MERLKGIGVSAGLAVGPALVAIQRTQVIRFPIAPDRVARELSALDRARMRSREQLQQIRRRVLDLRAADLAAIFDAQLLMLDDPMLVGRAPDRHARSGSTPNGPCSARWTRSPRCSTTSTTRTCTSARAICTTSPAVCA